MLGVIISFYGYEKLIHFNEMAASDFWAKNVSFFGITGGTSLFLTVFAEFFCSFFFNFGFIYSI
jgi:putative oxidoreductase